MLLLYLEGRVKKLSVFTYKHATERIDNDILAMIMVEIGARVRVGDALKQFLHIKFKKKHAT